MCATTAAATLPCRCPSSPLRRCGPSTIRLASCSSAVCDDALPGRRRLDGHAARQESGLGGQRRPVGGGPLGGSPHLGGPVGVEVLVVGRGEADVDGLPDAHDQGVSPRRQLGGGLRDRERGEFGSVVGEQHRPGGSRGVTVDSVS